MSSIFKSWRLGKSITEKTRRQVFKSTNSITVIEYKHGDRSFGFIPIERNTVTEGTMISPDNTGTFQFKE